MLLKIQKNPFYKSSLQTNNLKLMKTVGRYL